MARSVVAVGEAEAGVGVVDAEVLPRPVLSLLKAHKALLKSLQSLPRHLLYRVEVTIYPCRICATSGLLSLLLCFAVL